MKTGIELITEERQRQVTVEGWSPEHDDTHTNGEMASAAACYAMSGLDIAVPRIHLVITGLWPWSLDWWKPKSRIENLVRAGALIAAEIDRLQRKAATDAKEAPDAKPR